MRHYLEVYNRGCITVTPEMRALISEYCGIPPGTPTFEEYMTAQAIAVVAGSPPGHYPIANERTERLIASIREAVE